MAGWYPDDLNVQVARLSTEDEIPHTPADQPGSPSTPTDSLFNTANGRREHGIFKAKTGRHLDPCFTEKFSRFLRRDRIDVKPGAPFEAGDLRELRDDLQMPMVVVAGLFMKG